MLKIWGRLSSINVRKVVWTARELDLQYQRIDAGREFGGNKTPEYLRLNPNGLVPLIEDDGFFLWESNAIVRYLCAKHAPGTLWPTDLQARADVERWMEWQQTTLNRAGRDAFWQLIRTPPGQGDDRLLQQSNAATEPLFAMLDELLAERDFICGAQFGMADIVIGCEAHRWFELPQPHPTWPNVERWYAQVRARPATEGVLTLPLS